MPVRGNPQSQIVGQMLLLRPDGHAEAVWVKLLTPKTTEVSTGLEAT